MHDEDAIIVLHHGTTLRAAEAILEQGWQRTDPRVTITRVADEHGLTADDLIDDLTKYYRFAVGEDRGSTVSFAPHRGDAEHAWAQRAPEAEWEALWAVYRIKHMDRARDPWEWNSDSAGHTWVWDQMRANPLAVVSFTTTYTEMQEMGARSGGFRKSDLPPAEWLHEDSRIAIPEIVFDAPFTPPCEQVSITRIARHLPWYVFAAMLGLGAEEFRRRADAGGYGSPASDGVACPRRPDYAPWWTADHPGIVGR